MKGETWWVIYVIMCIVCLISFVFMFEYLLTGHFANFLASMMFFTIGAWLSGFLTARAWDIVPKIIRGRK